MKKLPLALILLYLLSACGPVTPVPPATHTPFPTYVLQDTATPQPFWCRRPEPQIFSGRLRLAYVIAGDVWALEEGEAAVQLTHFGDVSSVLLSDDGQVIAFTRRADRSEGIWVMDIDGASQRELIGAQDFFALGNAPQASLVIPLPLRWIPGTHSLAFNFYYVSSSHSDVFSYTPGDLWNVDADTGEFAPVPIQPGYFSYSPDGAHMVHFDRAGLRLYDLDGSDPLLFIFPDDRPSATGTQISWSADSRSFLAAVPDSDDDHSADSTFTVWRFHVDGSPTEQVGTFLGSAQTVHFSSDQRSLAYLRCSNAGCDHQELHVARIDGTQDATGVSGMMMEISGWRPGSYEVVLAWSTTIGYVLSYDPCSGRLQSIEGQGKWITWLDTMRYISWGGNRVRGSRLVFVTTDPALDILEPIENVTSFDVILLP